MKKIRKKQRKTSSGTKKHGVKSTDKTVVVENYSETEKTTFQAENGTSEAQKPNPVIEHQQSEIKTVELPVKTEETVPSEIKPKVKKELPGKTEETVKAELPGKTEETVKAGLPGRTKPVAEVAKPVKMPERLSAQSAKPKIDRKARKKLAKASAKIPADKTITVPKTVQRHRKQQLRSPFPVAGGIAIFIWLLVALYLVAEGAGQFFWGKTIFLDLAVLPQQMKNWDSAYPVWKMATTGAISFLAGFIFLSKAMGSSRLARRGQNDDRAAYLVEDSVLAAAISRKIREYADLRAGQVQTVIANKLITVKVKPTSGRTVTAPEILSQVKAELMSYKLDQTIKVKVHVTRRGLLG